MEPDRPKILKRPRGLLKTKKAESARDVQEEHSSKKQKTGAEEPLAEDNEVKEKTNIDNEDWEDLKELYEKAVEALAGNMNIYLSVG